MLRDLAAEALLDEELPELNIIPRPTGEAPHKMGDSLTVKQLESIVNMRQTNARFDIAVLGYRRELERRYDLYSCIRNGRLVILDYASAAVWVEEQNEMIMRRIARNVTRLKRISELTPEADRPKAVQLHQAWLGALRAARSSMRQMAKVLQEMVS